MQRKPTPKRRVGRKRRSPPLAERITKHPIHGVRLINIKQVRRMGRVFESGQLCSLDYPEPGTTMASSAQRIYGLGIVAKIIGSNAVVMITHERRMRGKNYRRFSRTSKLGDRVTKIKHMDLRELERIQLRLDRRHRLIEVQVKFIA